MAAHAGRLAELGAEVTGARAVLPAPRRHRGRPSRGSRTRAAGSSGEASPRSRSGRGRAASRFDLEGGQKTGFYLDQRENRAQVAAGPRDGPVLDAFALHGRLRGLGAPERRRVRPRPRQLRPARARAPRRTWPRTRRPGRAARPEVLEANAFDALRAFERDGRRFDLVVLDPPPFTRRRTALDAALRGYKEINLRALRCLGPGGLLATFSCSHHVSPALFEEVCRAAAEDVARPVRLAATHGPGAGPPGAPGECPETRYLTGLLLEVLGLGVGARLGARRASSARRRQKRASAGAAMRRPPTTPSATTL